MTQHQSASVMNWRQQAQRLHKEARTFYFAFKHPLTPWYAKGLAVCIAGYLFSPIQLIPSFIPVVGFLDDFLVLFLGLALLRRIMPPDVLAECCERASAAEVRRKEDTNSTPAVVAFVLIVTLWLLVAAAAGAVVVNHIPR